MSALLPYPAEEYVSIDRLYTGCQCEVTYSDEHTANIPSDKLSAVELIRTGKRVLVTGNPGYGKTTFLKQLVHRWVTENENDFILLFVPLKALEKNIKLSAYVKNSLLTQEQFTIDEIEKIIEKNKCLVLLDGLNEMSSESKDSTSSEDEIQYDISQSITADSKQFTIAECLSGEIHNYCKEIYVLVTSCRRHETLFPNCDTFVRLNEFSKDQVKEYIRKCCKWYEAVKETKLLTDAQTTDIETNQAGESLEYNDDTMVETKSCEQVEANTFKNTQDSSDREEKREQNESSEEHHPLLEREVNFLTDIGVAERDNETIEELQLSVFEFLEKRDIIDDFIGAPNLLFLMIQMMTSQFTNTSVKVDESRDLAIIDTATLIGCLIAYMEQKYIKESNNALSPTESIELKNNLGEIAIQTAFRHSFDMGDLALQNDIQKYVNIALAVGILQTQSSDTVHTSTEKSTIGFCHQYVHDYFTTTSTINNPNHFEKLLEMIKCNGVHHNFCKLSSLLERQSFQRLCNVLLESKCMTHVMYCLCEKYNQEEGQEIITEVSKHQINLLYRESNYYREAVRVFFQTCIKMKKMVECVVFAGKWPFSFFETIEWPELRHLEFYKMEFTENAFVRWVLMVREKNATNTLRFVKCGTPDSLSEQSVMKIKELNSSRLKVLRVFDPSNDIKPSSLNFNTGKWSQSWSF